MSKKKENCGNEKLIPKNEWVSADEIQGEDETKILQHPILERCFQKINQEFNPKHKIAFVSMCTVTRPYKNSRKFKVFFDRGYNKNADVIVGSSEGIVPEEYWESYPYMTYNTHERGKKNLVYINTLYNRFMDFFSKHHYDVIVFNYRPSLINRISAEKFKENYKGNSEIYILPTIETWENLKKYWKENKKTINYFPDLEPMVLKELDEVLLDK